MDDMYIKMIANTKKLKPQDVDARPSLSASQEARLFQILQAGALSSPSVLARFEEFVEAVSLHVRQTIERFEAEGFPQKPTQ